MCRRPNILDYVPWIFGYIEDIISELPKPLAIILYIPFIILLLCYLVCWRILQKLGILKLLKRIDENPHYRRFFWSKKAKQRVKDREQYEKEWEEYEIEREQRRKVRYFPRALDEHARGRDTGMTWSSPVNMQLDSPFWAMLPPEVRMLIWGELFGGHLIHITYELAYKRVTHRKYKGDSGDSLGTASERVTKWNGGVDLVGALLICRRM
jgi:hypothetical protein